jgi:WD40 repeat protein
MAFSPNGHTLATGSDDGTIQLWNLAAAAHPMPIGQPLTGDTSYINSVAFSPDGDTLASGSGDGTVRLWNMNVDDAIERICATAADLTPQQWQTYISQLSYQSPCPH